MLKLIITLLVMALQACAPQYPHKTEFRSRHYTQMPDADWCQVARADGWEPQECPK